MCRVGHESSNNGINNTKINIYCNSFTPYLIASPFSFKLFKVGSAGTFPTHTLTLDPPTVIVQLPQSPLFEER